MDSSANNDKILDKLKILVDEMSQEAGRRLTFHVSTFGCQMNARDSEKLSGILHAAGYEHTDSEDADFVIYNTCTVRENANNKVYGRLGYLHGFKKHNPNMKIALCGCMMQEAVVTDKLKKSYPFVDLIFGTHNLYRFPQLLLDTLTLDKPVFEVWDKADEIVEKLPVERKYPFKSGVNIMFGCDNFCSYCIVPYVRGREKSRRPGEIINEIEGLVKDGVVEVMLLGQNVNSYGKKEEDFPSFAELLERIAQIPGLGRIRFMTSHPKDLSDDLIDVMAKHKNICRHMHLPLQSGSDRILKEMNRHYTKDHYLGLVKKLRDAMPDISLTTDIIVGFPGEKEEDVKETMEVVRKVRFDSAFTFIYSRRTGTPAAKKVDLTPESEIKRRFQMLLKEVQQIGAEQTARFEGMEAEVLVEQINEQDSSLVTGRMDNNTVVHLPGDEKMIGRTVRVRLDECKGFYYLGSTV